MFGGHKQSVGGGGHGRGLPLRGAGSGSQEFAMWGGGCLEGLEVKPPAAGGWGSGSRFRFSEKELNFR